MTDPLFDPKRTTYTVNEGRKWVFDNYARDRYRDGWRNGFLIGTIATAIFIAAIVVGIVVS